MVVIGAVFAGLDDIGAEAGNQVHDFDPRLGGEPGGFPLPPECNILKTAPSPTGGCIAVSEKMVGGCEDLEGMGVPGGIGDVENRSFPICMMTLQLTALQPGHK